MRRIISVIFAALIFLCGCSKKEVIKYDLIVCDNALTTLGSYMDSFKGDAVRVEHTDFTADHISGLLVSLEESDDVVNSITVYSENIPEDVSGELIAFASEENIPVIFAVDEIPQEILASYDKAFSINTNYTHAAEITAEKMTDYWNDDIIIDRDGNYIFKFAVVKDEELSADMQAFHDTIIDRIELYGIPMQLTETVDAKDIGDAEDLEEIKENNEGIIVVSTSLISVLEEYSAEGDGVEVITVTQNNENIFSSKFSVLNCFVDYRQYKKAADELIDNYNNRNYMLEDFSFPYIDKTIYIPATV